MSARDAPHPAGPGAGSADPLAPEALVIGAGPAGLMAAEVLAGAGHRVLLVEAMPSPARKLLMAGKSGLNLTKAEPVEVFADRIRTAGPGTMGDRVARIVAVGMAEGRVGGTDGTDPCEPAGFGPAEVAAWAEGLGIALFAGSTGRVFPVGMKASPLLRAWLARLAAGGVVLRTRWRWVGVDGFATPEAPGIDADSGSALGTVGERRGGRAVPSGGFVFDTPEGTRVVRPDVAVLALGGASWPRLGSDGAWVPMLRVAGIPVAPFRPANMGFRVDWSVPMARQFGHWVKGTTLRAGDLASRGEWVITPAGIEGGGVYEVAAALRDGAPGVVDLAPDLDRAELTRRLQRPRGKVSLGNWLRRCLGDPVKVALLLEWGGLPATSTATKAAAHRDGSRDAASVAAGATGTHASKPGTMPTSADDWAGRIKALPLRHAGPMGLERAISSAGGVRSGGLDGLELTALPGTFVAGEMLDWEAPTGGYLLTACMASGRAAGLAAAARLAQIT